MSKIRSRKDFEDFEEIEDLEESNPRPLRSPRNPRFLHPEAFLPLPNETIFCYNNRIMFSQRKVVGALVFALLLAIPTTGEAAAGAQALAMAIKVRVIDQALIAFWGIAAAAVFYYGARMIISAQNEQSYQDFANSLIYALVGFAIISCAMAFTTAFTTANASVLGVSIESVSAFLIRLALGVFILMIVVSALRMATSGGEQGEFDKWRKVLIGACLGAGILVLARVMVIAIADRSASAIGGELAGILLFLLTIAGFVCAIAIVAAGIMLIISIDESLKDRAKKTIISTLIALAFVMASYAIISYFAR